MEIRTFRPSAALAPFVRTFELVEVPRSSTRTVLPEAGAILGFRYAGSATLLDGAAAREVPWSSFTGPRRTVRQIRTSAGSGVLLAKLHEDGAAAFFAHPLHELVGVTCALDELVARRDVELTAARIIGAASDAERLAAFEALLVTLRARRAWRPDPMVGDALRAIRADPASPRIVTTLAAGADLSVDAFEKRFRRSVGTSPKQVASIIRLRGALDPRRPASSLTELAIGAGYYDQSHFIRQFVAATGTSPRRFLQHVAWCL